MILFTPTANVRKAKSDNHLLAPESQCSPEKKQILGSPRPHPSHGSERSSPPGPPVSSSARRVPEVARDKVYGSCQPWVSMEGRRGHQHRPSGWGGANYEIKAF